MFAKKDNTITGDVALSNGGSITYASEVIAIIAGVAASEVEGVAGMCAAGGINEKIGKNRNVTRGVKVELGTEEVSVELFMVIEYSKPIHKVAADVQENVRKAVEGMTGLHVVKVDVHVEGVSFEKDKKAGLTAGESAPALRSAEPAPAQEAQVPAQEAQEAVNEAAEEVKAAAAEAEQAKTEAEEVIAEAQEAAAEAAEEAEEIAGEATEETVEAAEEAVETAEEAAGEIAEEVTEAAEETVKAATEAADKADGE